MSTDANGERSTSTGDIPIGERRRRAVVVGGGPVGCLAALSLAKQGWDVEVYEGRPDANSPKQKEGLRSVNLAISARGIAAIRAVDPAMAKSFLEDTIPMKGRMIHATSGSQHPQAYDILGQCINAVDRGLINKRFQGAMHKTERIRTFYEHRLTQADFDKRILTFLDTSAGKEVDVGFDFCIGADGSYSNVRRQLMRVVQMDYSQFYIPHEYMEFKMPPRRDAGGNPAFKLDPNYLHIWPRKSFMFIALANKDKSFTCSLFAPGQDLAALKEPSVGLEWMKAHFPDAVPLIGESAVLDAFRNNPKSPLIAIKANPYHYKDRVVILGDAAHSMVPFFGQGLNCGLEDVRVLDIILREEGVQAARPIACAEDAKTNGEDFGVVDSKLASALRRYTERRYDDLLAISDLSLANLVEMQHSVATPAYLLHRALDNVLAHLTRGWQAAPSTAVQQLSEVPFPSSSPAGWLPLYSMVTFRPDISYSTLKRKAERQEQVVRWVGGIGTAAALLGIIGFAGLKLVAKR